MTKIINFWEKRATEQMTLHPTAKEYSPVLVLVSLGKFVTLLFSVAGGIHYFVSAFQGLYVPLVIFASGLLLILLEGLNLFSLFKALKMTLRGKPLQAVVLGLVSLVLFGLSFFVTTEGAKVWKAQQTTQRTEITRDFERERTETKLRYQNRIDALQAAISPLTRFAWKSDVVEKYNTQIDQLQAQQAKELKNIGNAQKQAHQTDQAHTDRKAYQFWVIGVLLMVAQVVFNVVLAVLYNRIHIETQQTQRIDEELLQLRESRLQNFYTQIQTDFRGLENLFLQRLALSGATSSLAISAQTNTQNQSNTKPNTEKTKPFRRVGFAVDNQTVPTESVPTESVLPESVVTTESVGKAENQKLTPIQNNERTNGFPHLACSQTDGQRYFDAHGQKVCPNCGKPVNRGHWAAVYCSDACKAEFWERKTGRNLHKILKRKQ